MSIAYEFLNEKHSLEFSSKEDMINFIIDHYGQLIDVYRVMKLQNIATKEKQENAHQALQAVRRREEMTDGSQLNETEKLALKKTKEYLSNLREEDDVHHYNREPLETNHLTMLIENHPLLMATLDWCDSLVRNKLAKITPRLLETLLAPVSFLTRKSIDHTPAESVKTLESLKILRTIIASAPEDVRDIILESMEIDLDDHLPKNDNDDEEQSYSF